MAIHVESEHLNGVLVLRPDTFPDERGLFSVVYQKEFFSDIGLSVEFEQDNYSRSVKNVLRGLHFQYQPPMAKLMRVGYGRAFLVAVDIRKNSPTLGQWFGTIVSSDDCRMLWAPAGFARGLCALSDEVILHYKCTRPYNQKGESGVAWNDPDIGIKWPISDPLLSPKDREARSLRDWLSSAESENFKF